jgi:succinate dehydrogenase flavin-adding protein (antitoxin of CptAB toxin-antitoxin module)
MEQIWQVKQLIKSYIIRNTDDIITGYCTFIGDKYHMDSLSELINLLTVSDKKLFKQFLERKNKRIDVKNLQLLDLIATDDISGINKLYSPAKNKDAYHALRKRLQDNLLLFLSQKTFESSHADTYEALRLVVAGRFLLENDVVKVAFKCLDKAERLAEHLEQFNLLNELLLLKLQYAHLPGAEDLETLTASFERNQFNMQREAKLNIAYAFLRQELQEIHLKGKVVNLTGLLIATIRKYKISVQDLMTYKSIYQILFIANEYAAIQQNYGLIARYVNRINLFIQRPGYTKEPYLFYHISILYFLANFHLRQKDFVKSTSYLKEMMELMLADNRYYTLFYLRHQLLSALKLFFTGFAEKTIRLLQEALSGVKPTAKTEDIEDIRICLTMFLALCNDRRSLKQLSLLTQTDAWYEKKMGMLWTIRKNLMEILVQAQFSNVDLAMSRLTGFRRRYKKYLLKTSEERVLLYLKLVEKYLMNPDVTFEPAYRKAVLNLAGTKENKDIFTLSFIAWLVAHWDKRTAYEVVLTFIRDDISADYCSAPSCVY